MSRNQAFEYKPMAGRKIITVYDYKDETGNVIFQKERWEPKGFRLRRCIDGQQIYNLDGIRPLPYRLPAWKDSPNVIVCEGEKDADSLADLGFASTSGPFGAASWPEELTPWFKGKCAYILYDVGEEVHAEEVAAAIAGTAKEIRICDLGPDLPREFDISDLLNMIPPEEKPRRISAVQDILRAARIYQPPSILNIKPITPRRLAGQLTAPEVHHAFLNLWVDSISRVTDAPQIFAIFAGLGVLSAVLNKHWFSYPRRTNLNLYLLLLAPSTVCRKSVVLDIADDYLREVNPEIIFPESFTPEALLDFLKEHPSGIILWRELIQVGGFAFGQDYNKALPSVLTDLYDTKARFRRLLKSEAPLEINYPSISILAAGIQSWLISMMTGRQNEFYGGLWTRFLLISAPDEKEKPFRLPSRLVLISNIIQKLQDLHKTNPREIMLDPIFPHLNAWGREHQRQALLIERPEMQASFMRFEVALIKIAGLLQLSSDPGSSSIELPAFEQAVKIIEYLKADLPRFFEEHVLFSEPERDQAAVLRVIRKAFPAAILGSDISRFTRLPKKRRDVALVELRERTAIKIVSSAGSQKGGRPGTAYLFAEVSK